MYARPKIHTYGFSLIELAMVLVIAGLMVSFGLQANQSASTSNPDCYASTRFQLVTIRAAVERFANKNDRLPLPAARNIGVENINYGRESSGANIDTAGTSSWGAVPFQALGLSPSYGGDCWGNKLIYVVTTALTTNATSGGYLDSTALGTITLKSSTANTTNTNTAYAIISAGEDGYGAVKLNYSAANAGGGPPDPAHKWCAGPALKAINCSVSSATVVDSVFNDGNNAGANYYDDIILAAGKSLAYNSNLYCWGTDSSSYGVLGDGSLTSHVVKTPARAASNVQFASFSNLHKRGTNISTPCGLTTDGTAYCWGLGTNGQLGNGLLTNSAVPVKVNTTVKFKSIQPIYPNFNINCGIALDDTAYCWGSSQAAAGVITGYAASVNVTTPTQISPTLKFSKLYGNNSGYSMCGLTLDGSVYCWGKPGSLLAGGDTFNSNPVGPTLVSGTRVFSSVTGADPLCGVTAASDPGGAGVVYCWGYSFTCLSCGAGTGIMGYFGVAPLTITGITQANPAVVTYTVPASGLSLKAGDIVEVHGMNGMNCLNYRSFFVKAGHYTANSIELYSNLQTAPVSVDTTSCTPYTSAGVLNVEARNTVTPIDAPSGVTFAKMIDSEGTSTVQALDTTGQLWSWGAEGAYAATGDNAGSIIYGVKGFSSVTIGNPTVVNFASAHGFLAGDRLYAYMTLTPVNTAAGGQGGTITLNASESAVDNALVGNTICNTSGVGAGGRRTITKYVGASKIATLSQSNGNATSSTYYIQGTPITPQGGTSTTITLDPSASAVDNFYNGMTVVNNFGTVSCEGKTITAYNGTTKVATISGTFNASYLPSATTTYMIGTPLSAQGGSSTSYIILDNTASTVDNFYTGMYVQTTGGAAGTNNALITSYDGTNKIAYVSSWTGAAPDTATSYAISPSQYGGIGSTYMVGTVPNSTSFQLVTLDGVGVDSSHWVGTPSGFVNKIPPDSTCYYEAGGASWRCNYVPTAATQTVSGVPFSFADVYPGDNLSVGIGTTGEVYAWGNTYMGDNTSTVRNVPTPISHPGVTFVAPVYHMSNNACVFSNIGELWCWGKNASWTNGITTQNNLAPVKVANQSATVKFIDVLPVNSLSGLNYGTGTCALAQPTP